MVRGDAGFCICCHDIAAKPNNLECNSCLRRAIVNYLSSNGFNATLSTSHWKPRKKILGGKHEYIDVVAASYRGEAEQIKKEMRYVIELEFRGEFELAKASEEYEQLLNLVPQSYVGKPENMNAIVRVICNAAKRSMEERNIHMGPWREHSFMQMKWSSPSSSSSSSSDLRLCNCSSNAVEVS